MATDAAQGIHSSNVGTTRRALAATGFRRLAGFKKKGVKTTVSVNPPPLDGGASGTVDVTVAGVKTPATSRQQFLAYVPAALAAGLAILSVQRQATNTVRITLKNTTGNTIDGDPANWDIYLFDGAK